MPPRSSKSSTASGAQPGAYRSIRVVAKDAVHGKLLVRTRAGYIAGAESQPAKHQDIQ